MRLALICLLGAISVALAGSPGSGFEVRFVGEMRKVMREGDLRATIDLKQLSETRHLYALGPIEGLRGEITVWDGTPLITRIRDGRIAITNGFEVKACFLVYAQVESWQEVAIPDEVRDEKQLETFVATAAAKHGIYLARPFPFAFEGVFENAAFHVMNKVDDAPHTPENHEKVKVHFVVENAGGRLIGFYSDRHHGVFTHHLSNVHMHVITDDEKQSGHVESIRLAKGGRLLLPKR